MHRSACGTDKGNLRKTNEDSMLGMDSMGFYMVAGGGRSQFRQVASRLAVELMKDLLLSTRRMA